jgi:GT2 family glycosyltransferase
MINIMQNNRLINYQVVMILGMHRSGTSALARILNLLGVNLGSLLLPAHPTNQTGFWEHLAVVRANEMLLKQLDSAWFDTTPLPAQWWEWEKLAPIRQYCREILWQEFAHCPLWGIKEPRLCRLLPFWLPLIQEMNPQLGFVIIVRHPLEVATSLAQRDGLSYNVSLRLWLQHVSASVQDSQAFPQVLLTYDELLTDWRATVGKIAQALNLQWREPVEKVAALVDDFLSPALKHHRVSQLNLSQFTINYELLKQSEAIYRTLQSVASGKVELKSIASSAVLSRTIYQQLFSPPIENPRFHFLLRLNHRWKARKIALLNNTLATLRQQEYPHWQLSIIANFHTQHCRWWELPNVRWRFSQSSRDDLAIINEEIAVIKADWIVLMAVGDRCEPQFLTRCVEYLAVVAQQKNQQTPLQFLYVDEDKVTPRGEFFAPHFKPDFNLDLLRAMPYMGTGCLIRREALQAVGGFVSSAGLELYDLALKIYDHYGETAFGHLAQLLYHQLSFSQPSEQRKFIINPLIPLIRCTTTHNLNQKKAKAAQAILQQHLQRQKLTAQVEPTAFANIYWINYASTLAEATQLPAVSIVIATRNSHASLSRCLTSLLTNTAYPHYRLLILDNETDDADTLAYFQSLSTYLTVPFQLFRFNSAQSPSELTQFAIQQTKDAFLVFINDDIELTQAHWLAHLVAIGQRAEVGIVAPRILDSQQRVLHAGYILGMGKVGVAGQINQGLSINDLGYQGRAQATQNFSAVADSCLLLKKSAYESANHTSVEPLFLFNEIDLCLTVTEAGYKIVWTPQVTLIQHDSGSLVRHRKQVIDHQQFNQEVAAIHTRWLPQRQDPAYNPHLTLSEREWQPETYFSATWQGMPTSPTSTRFRRPRIIAFPHDAWGVGEYRVRTPLRALQQAKLVDYALLPNDDEGKIPTVAELARLQADILWLHNSLHDQHLYALSHSRRLQLGFTLFGLDDLIYALPKSNPYHRTNYRDIKQRIEHAIALSERLIVTTEPLAAAYRHLTTDIALIPNYLESAHWQGLTPKRRQGRKPRIGWAGAGQHLGDLAIIIPLVKALAGQVEWIFFGCCPPAIKPYVDEYYDMVPFAQYPAKLANLNLDLALAPLAQNAFNEAKSQLRVLEYGILGYPVVGTDILPYQSAPIKRVANTETAWLTAVQERLADLDATAKEGEELKEWVLNHWLLENHLTEWAQALNLLPRSAAQLRFEREKIAKKWLIILSCEFSGSELLIELLSQHPLIAPLAANDFALPNFAPIVDIPSLWTENAAAVKLTTTDHHKNHEILTTAGLTKITALKNSHPQGITYLAIANLPGNMARSLWLQQQLPNSYFLHLKRDSHAVALALREHIQQQHDTQPLLLHRAAQHWRRSLELLQADVPRLHRYQEISYETLIDDPLSTLNSIFAWLGLEPLCDENSGLAERVAAARRHRQSLVVSAEQRAVVSLVAQGITATNEYNE